MEASTTTQPRREDIGHGRGPPEGRGATRSDRAATGRALGAAPAPQPKASWASLVKSGQRQASPAKRFADECAAAPPPPETILELRAQGGRVLKLVNLDDIKRRERELELRATNMWQGLHGRRARNPDEVCTALDLPVEIWSHILSFLDDASDFCSAALACHLFRAALTDRRCWAMARIPIYNPEWTQDPGCEFAFLQPNDSLHAFGFRFTTEEQLAQLKHHNIRRIILQGPNILRAPAHIQQLTVELPNITEITFFCAALSTESLNILHQNCKSLAAVRAVNWNFSAVLRLTALSRTTTLYLEQCVGVSQLQILNLCRSLPNLKRLFILGCSGINMDVLRPVSKAHKQVQLMWAPQSTMFEHWYFRRAWPALPVNGFS